jgi:predicted lactoylglutathione lyase
MKQIFINLLVQDLEKSVAFYTQLGFEHYPLFTFDDQKCLAWGEQILLMLHAKSFFNVGETKPIVDTKKYLTPSFTLPVENYKKVNEIVARVLKADGTETHAMVDEGFMQVRTIEDLDGYQWGIICLDIAAFKKLKSK